VRTGARIALHHLPFGVGSGRYPDYDPVHTAPHSLPLEVAAEDGLLASMGLLAVLGWLLVALVRLLRAARGEKPPAFELRVACVVGSLAFLTLGFVGGVPLLLGSSNVWTALLALQVSLAAILERP
jgi:O-antigen ligase